MKKAALVTLVDKNWLEYAKQVFSGAHFNAGWKHDYILMTHNVPEEDTIWFKDKGIIIYRCEDLGNYINVHSAALNSTMYRLFLFTDFFKEWEYLLFVDADTIILGSLDCLLNHKGFMAAEDSNRNTLNWQLKGERSELNTYQQGQYNSIRTNLNVHSPSFNAGVFSMHASQIESSTFVSLCQLYESYIDLFATHMYDQALLNVFFYKKWLSLPAQYNIFVNFSFINYCRSVRMIDAYILHFAGPKPWHKPWHSKNPYYRMWKKLLAKSEEINLNHRCSPKKASDFDSLQQSSRYLAAGWVRNRARYSKYYSLHWRLKKFFKS